VRATEAAEDHKPATSLVEATVQVQVTRAVEDLKRATSLVAAKVQVTEVAEAVRMP
jgi:hypothetical protein